MSKLFNHKYLNYRHLSFIPNVGEYLNENTNEYLLTYYQHDSMVIIDRKALLIYLLNDLFKIHSRFGLFNISSVDFEIIDAYLNVPNVKTDRIKVNWNNFHYFILLQGNN